MKKQFIAEAKRMQQLAGIIVEEDDLDISNLDDLIASGAFKTNKFQKSLRDLNNLSDDELVLVQQGFGLDFYKLLVTNQGKLIKPSNPVYNQIINSINHLPYLKKAIIKSKIPINLTDRQNSPYVSNGGNLNPNSVSGDIYDFGGDQGYTGDDRSKVIAIDIVYEGYSEIELDNEAKEQGYKACIYADLDKIHSFPPLNGINLHSTLMHIDSKNNLSKTINNSLNSGGIIFIADYATEVNELLAYLSSYKILSLLPENIGDSTGYIFIVLQK